MPNEEQQLVTQTKEWEAQGVSIVIAPSELTCHCGKKIGDVGELHTLNTPLVDSVNNVCKGCKIGEEAAKKLWTLVCYNCHRVMGRYSPYRESNTGFQTFPGVCYHATFCGDCRPAGSTEDPVFIEKEVYYRKIGRTS